MQDFKFYGECKACKTPKWLVRRRKLIIPVGEVTSRELICKDCYKQLRANIEKDAKKD